MIETYDQLHDHVNRFRAKARFDGAEGELRIYGSGRVALHRPKAPGERRAPASIPIPKEALATDADPRLELTNLDGSWVPVEEWEHEALAARIERFGALHNYETLVGNYDRLVGSLRQAVEEMAPEDAERFALPDFPAVDHFTDEYRDSII